MATENKNQYFDDCLVLYKCLTCQQSNFWCDQKLEFDKLPEDLKERIYSIFRNGCSLWDHDAKCGDHLQCRSNTCPHPDFKINGWTTLELGHILHKLRSHISNLQEREKEEFNSFTISDFCYCTYLFNDTIIKFIKTDKEKARHIWNTCDRLNLLSKFKRVTNKDKIVKMTFDQLVIYVDQNVQKTYDSD